LRRGLGPSGRTTLLSFCSPAPIYGATAHSPAADCCGHPQVSIKAASPAFGSKLTLCYRIPGFTLKLLLAGGRYIYPSSGLRMDVDGNMVSASALPGWRMTRDGLTVGLYAGPIIQDYRLMPYDPGSLLRGAYAGGQIAADIWYRPDPATMIAFDGSIASIGLVGSARAAIGWRSSEPFFIGPETQAIWCVDYQQIRFGGHVTGFRVDALEWSAAGGWAIESFRRAGPYVRLGFNTRY
jgi:hypothetical protein